MVIVLVSMFSLVYTKLQERRSIIEQEHRKQKAAMYSNFIAALFIMLRAGQTGTQVSQVEVNKRLDEFTRELII